MSQITDAWSPPSTIDLRHPGGAPPRPIPPEKPRPQSARAQGRWWRFNALLALVATGGVLTVAVVGTGTWLRPASAQWWIAVVVAHLPWFVLLAFLAGGLIERIGYFWRGRTPARPGHLPADHPRVCVQLPMFNEAAVARRLIEAACAMRWRSDRFEVQVLDDSTEPDVRLLVDGVCAEMRSSGVDCTVIRRERRDGYKAGALEVGRSRTGADLLVILDADFLPQPEFLEQVVPHFFDDGGEWLDDLAMVQAQWGHLNHDDSGLTRAQSLWVDDHHTVQMSWRAAQWGFVNFTGTAGVWRASAVERAGGWRAASLVEDCELSFRHLFAGYRTTFVKEIVVPAELPATYTAYKAQQRRWTAGWVQLQRLHLRTLLFDHPTTRLRKLHLIYHMCISTQWAIWAAWLLLLPFLIASGTWFGALGSTVGALAYLGPTTLWVLVATVIASVETRHTYPERLTPRVLLRRLSRVVPFMAINTGMLPHQFSAFTEGLFGPMHSEFERTPKTAAISTASGGSAPATAARPVQQRRQAVKVHRPYVVTEVFFVAFQLTWAILFLRDGLWVSAGGSTALAACVLGLMYFYGDHLGRRLFVFRTRR
jgi:cellulose synthase/poly-beta-1,6-N-acetylglucosamine synthase-like glycosyltransferase